MLNLTNRLLKRQLKKANIRSFDDLDEARFARLLQGIERSYYDYEDDKKLYESVAEITSREFQELNLNLEHKVAELERINTNIRESIEYASLMQQAILPNENTLEHFFGDHFICWQPRDIVGGDIYFVSPFDEDKLLIMVIDGAGHGVSGAFLTMLVKAIEGQIMGKIKEQSLEPSPAAILSYFNRSIKQMLQQVEGSQSNSGFDGGILYYDKSKQICRYAGAKTPLYIMDDQGLQVIRSDRKSVGYVRNSMEQRYTDHEIPVTPGCTLYITTDGLVDQEGADQRLYGAEQFKSFIREYHTRPCVEQYGLLKKSFYDFKGEAQQSDDVTVLGLVF